METADHEAPRRHDQRGLPARPGDRLHPQRLPDVPCATYAEFARAVVDGLDGPHGVPHQAAGLVTMEKAERVPQLVIDDSAHPLNEELL